MVKNLSSRQETLVLSLGQADPLEQEMASYSSILAWRIPWTEELVGYSPRGCKESDMTEATGQQQQHHEHSATYFFRLLFILTVVRFVHVGMLKRSLTFLVVCHHIDLVH